MTATATMGQRARSIALTPLVLGFVASERLRRHPFRRYGWLQQIDPVHHSPLGILLLSRHADVQAVLRNPHMGSDESKADSEAIHLGPLNRLLGAPVDPEKPREEFLRLFDHLMLFQDPPDHTRLRGLVAKAFTPRRIDGLRPRIEAIVDELLEPHLGSGAAGAGSGGIELMSQLAYPLPARVICELLGVPDADHDLFVHHAPALATSLDPAPMRTSEGVARANDATIALTSCLDDLIAERRARPRDDLLSALISAEEGGATLSHDELVATVLLLVLAGHETTANVIGNATRRLVSDRPALAKLAATDDDSIGPAVDELLRLDGPVQMAERITLDTVEIGGTPVPPGRIVVVLIGAANRDPAVYPDPHRLDLTRQPNPHLAFGGGHHFCIGAALARLELRVALPAIARRLPAGVSVARAVRRPSFTLRGLEQLQLRW